MPGRGFKSFTPEKLRQVSSAGGRRAHELGVAHEFTRDEAREAGRKGGTERGRRRRAEKAP